MPSWVVGSSDADLRIDAAVAKHLGVSIAQARRLIIEGLVLVDGRKARKGARTSAETRLEVRAEVRQDPVNPGRSYDFVPAPDRSLLLDVVYEDEALVAVNKPAGIPSHPLREKERGTVAHAIVARWPTCPGASLDTREAGLVHRLDRGTTGVLIAAKRREVWLSVREAFERQEVDKTYWALVEGRVDEPIVIDAPLRTVNGSARVGPAADALPALTRARPLVVGEDFTLVEAIARTGRMHQVRAHLADAGFPLVGDRRYGARQRENVPPDEALLHARAVTLPHPVDGWRLTIAAPVPAIRAALMERLLGRSLPGALTEAK